MRVIIPLVVILLIADRGRSSEADPLGRSRSSGRLDESDTSFPLERPVGAWRQGVLY